MDSQSASPFFILYMKRMFQLEGMLRTADGDLFSGCRVLEGYALSVEVEALRVEGSSAVAAVKYVAKDGTSQT